MTVFGAFLTGAGWAEGSPVRRRADSPAHFEQISGVVTEDMAVGAVGAVGLRVEKFVDAVRPYVEAGYDEPALAGL